MATSRRLRDLQSQPGESSREGQRRNFWVLFRIGAYLLNRTGNRESKSCRRDFPAMAMKPGSMDQWRDYFRTANSDIFDIIDHAITVAAIDCPKEFRLRRDQIAEKVLIQGLCKCGKFDDAVEFCLEMLEAGHSPNVITFVGLIDGLCREKGVEEAKSVIGDLKQKGFDVNNKAVREFLDKKAPFSPLVWEAIFGMEPRRKTSF